MAGLRRFFAWAGPPLMVACALFILGYVIWAGSAIMLVFFSVLTHVGLPSFIQALLSVALTGIGLFAVPLLLLLFARDALTPAEREGAPTTPATFVWTTRSWADVLAWLSLFAAAALYVGPPRLRASWSTVAIWFALYGVCFVVAVARRWAGRWARLA